MLDVIKRIRNGLNEGRKEEEKEQLRATLQTALRLAALRQFRNLLFSDVKEFYYSHPEPPHIANIFSEHHRFERKRDHLVGTLLRQLYPDNWQAALANEIFVRPETLRDAFLPQGQPLVLSTSGIAARSLIIAYGKDRLIRMDRTGQSEIEASCSDRDRVGVCSANHDQLQRLFLGECRPPDDDAPLKVTEFTDNRIDTIFRMWAAFRVAEVGLQNLADKWRSSSHDYQNCNVNEWMSTILNGGGSNEEKLGEIYKLADDVGLAVTLVGGAKAAFGIESQYSFDATEDIQQIVNIIARSFLFLKEKLGPRLNELRNLELEKDRILSDCEPSHLNAVVSGGTICEAYALQVISPIPEYDLPALQGTEIQAENTKNRPETDKAALEILRVAVGDDEVGKFLLDSLERRLGENPNSR